MFKSIKTKMIVLVSVMLFLLIAGSSFYAFRQSEDILSNTLQSEAENSARKSVETIRLWTEEKGKMIKNLSYLDSIKSMNWERQYSNLKPISDDDPQIESLFIVEPDGTMKDTNQFETSVANQNYFKRVKETKEQVFSEPTESFETGRPITIIASPIFRDDEFVGIVGAVVALDILQEMAADMDINGNGYGMILDQNGIIKYTNKAWKDFAKNNGLDSSEYDVGSDYLKVVKKAKKESGEGAKRAAEAYKGIKDVMKGKKKEFVLKYPCHSPEEERWFKMHVKKFKNKGDYSVLISHKNINY